MRIWAEENVQYVELLFEFCTSDLCRPGVLAELLANFWQTLLGNTMAKGDRCQN